jgi:polar amino acid transport system permease protein
LTYVFQFGVVADNWDALLRGAWLTLELSVAASLLGLVLAILCAVGRSDGPRPLRAAIALYIETIRNTPFLIQLFFLYFSLPAIGLRLDATVAALIGMTISFGAYGTEIVRAGIEAVPQGQVEAGRALGLSTYRIWRHIILFPAIRAVFPALASQIVLLLLGSSIVAVISAEELTAIANSLQSRTFRAFEIYFAVTLLYLGMAMGLRGLFGGLYWVVFERGRVWP